MARSSPRGPARADGPISAAHRAPKACCDAAHTTELRDACIAAAREAIARHGIESLSLRDVARRLGVSHQAPYKHYPSRDHLLAEVMRRCFQQFARHLDAREHFDDPHQDLESLGRQYLSYAQQHPLEYRLMFGTPWPASAEHSELLHDSTHAFDILRQVLRRSHGSSAKPCERVDLDAMFVWSTLHGLVGVMNGNCVDKLGLHQKVLGQVVQHVMGGVVRGLSDARPTQPA
jgi:AcrR family transcriptional regulator